MKIDGGIKKKRILSGDRVEKKNLKTMLTPLAKSKAAQAMDFLDDPQSRVVWKLNFDQTSCYISGADSISGLQSPSGMNQLSNAAMHFQPNPGGGLTLPTLPLDTSSTMPGHAVAAVQQGEPVRRKRGRPRKYGHDRGVSLALKPPMSNLTPTQKWRGRPPGSGRKEQSHDLGGSSMFCGAGTMTPHILNVNAGEDIKRRILSISQGRKTVVLLSAFGSISAANIRTSSSTGSVTYEGHFDIVSLSGSYILDTPHGPMTGGLNVSFSGPDGRLIGGPVDEALIAASSVQVVLGILIPSSGPKAKTKASDYTEASGEYDRPFCNLLTPANLQQPSQNMASLGNWQSPR